jgi:tRNA (Thr-GGU) A37 N-methylase
MAGRYNDVFQEGMGVLGPRSNDRPNDIGIISQKGLKNLIEIHVHIKRAKMFYESQIRGTI